MDLKELQRMTTPKLRDLAKESTDLQGVVRHAQRGPDQGHRQSSGNCL